MFVFQCFRLCIFCVSVCLCHIRPGLLSSPDTCRMNSFSCLTAHNLLLLTTGRLELFVSVQRFHHPCLATGHYYRGLNGREYPSECVVDYRDLRSGISELGRNIHVRRGRLQLCIAYGSFAHHNSWRTCCHNCPFQRGNFEEHLLETHAYAQVLGVPLTSVGNTAEKCLRMRRLVDLSACWLVLGQQVLTYNLLDFCLNFDFEFALILPLCFFAQNEFFFALTTIKHG